MEVEGPPTEITPSPSTGALNNHGVSTKDAGFVLPYNTDLVEANRVSSSSGRLIKLQVEVNSDYKFLTICDPAHTLADLKTQLEIEYTELYPNELPIVIVRLQDSKRNDLLRDKDKIYIVMKPIISEDDSAETSTPAPRQRGRKRKNMDKEVKLNHDTPNKKPLLSSLSPSQVVAQFPQPHSSSQPSTSTQIQHQLQQQQLQQQQMQGALTPYSSPAAKVPLPSQNTERVVCNPYCALIETRDSVPCAHCGELRPYVVPDAEKTDRNQCSKWCVTGSTRKLKAAGLEFCSICLARHRAGKYDLRKAHQCQMCHRPWLHLDEYMYCRTCRKSAMGSDKDSQQIPAPIILNNPLSLLTGNGTSPLHHLSPPQQHLPHPHTQIPSHLTHQQSPLLTHTRMHSPPQHISMHDLHKRPEHDKLKGDQKTQSIPLQQLHHFQQQSQQLLGVNSPQHHSPSSSKDDSKDDKDGLHHLDEHAHHHITQEHHHDEHAHGEHAEHVHGHAQDHGGHAQDHGEHAQDHGEHAHMHPQNAEQLAEMVLSSIPAAGQDGEAPIGNSYYDATIPISSQEKVGS